MKEFLDKLYSYENFGLWLMISIIILVLLFIVILFLGKKDKKNREIEATRKLQQLNDENAFKEESKVDTVETKEVKQEEPVVNLNDKPLEAPLINNVEVNNVEVKPEVPVQEEAPIISLNELDKKNEELNQNNEITKEFTAPILDAIQEEIKLPDIEISNANEVNNNNDNIEMPKINETNNINVEMPKEEIDKTLEMPLLFNEEAELNVGMQDNNNKEVVNDTKEEILPEIKVPEFDLDSVINEITQEIKIPQGNREVFSSVYTKEENNNKEEEMEVTLPELKNVNDRAKAPTSDELDFELPTLKKEYTEKEEKLEIPKLNNYNIDNISGEYYNINR